MAGKNGRTTKKTRKSGSGNKTNPPRFEPQEHDDGDKRLTLEALDAISTDSEDEPDTRGGAVIEAGGSGDEEEEWDAEAAALRRAIADGAFDKIGIDVRKKQDDGDDEDYEERSAEDEQSGKDEQDEVEDVALEDDSSEDEEGDEEDAQQGAELMRMEKAAKANSKALNVVANELTAAHSAMAWSEALTVVPSNPLPFGGAGGRDGNALDVHDDLKREVAFYNTAIEAVIEARAECERIGLPFRRPDDFFAEMVKTDDHMAKVKDRLIFETKKMEAFEQRKSNKEIKLRAKEARANKAVEKAYAKKEHLKAVDDWAKSAASNRVPGAIRDDDDYQLSRLSGGGGGGVNKKRQRADNKYGYGGKRGRFKQNDPRDLNDMSDFNPRGNFGGLGTKSGKASKGGGGGSGGGAKRKGKRARDAARSRR